MKTKHNRIVFIIAMILISFTINFCAAQTVTPCWLIFEQDTKVETIDRSLAIKPNVTVGISKIGSGQYIIAFMDQDKGSSYLKIRENKANLTVYNGKGKIKILNNKGTVNYIEL